MAVEQIQKINGINTEAFKKLRATIAQDASKGKAVFHVRTTWEGGTKSQTSVDSWEFAGEEKDRAFTVAADEPEELLGTSTSANPQEMLMAAVNACMMATYVGVCAMKGIELESLEIETRGELDLRGFLALDPNVKPGYEHLNYTVRIKGNATEQQFQEVHQAVMETSPNHWNMANPIKMQSELVVEQ